MGLAQTGGDYPLLGGGDTNPYRLFVERSTDLIDRNGLMALLSPSGIYGDQSAARFFGKVAGQKRLLALYDCENRRGPNAGQFFPDVDSRFKFCTLIVGGVQRTAEEIPCGYLLHDPPANTEPERLLTMHAGDFALVNPKTGTAPVFLTRLCTDIDADPLQIVQWYMLRWQVQVTFEELRAHLGMETQRQWSEPPIARTTPALSR